MNPHTISLVLDHISATKGTATGAVYVKYSFDREKRGGAGAVGGAFVGFNWLAPKLGRSCASARFPPLNADPPLLD
jgi:hypothetical protein